MTMQFRLLKKAVVQLLGDNANNEFRVFGYQPAPGAASEFVNKDRAIRVYYDNGNFPKSASSPDGPFHHALTMNVELIVTAKASVDIAVLEDPESTPQQRSDALLAVKEANDKADDIFDELLELVYQILMGAENIDLGMPDFTLGEARWIDSMKKDKPISNGEYVILTGEAPLTTSVSEEVTGEIPIPLEEGKLATVISSINGDETQATGFNKTGE